MRSDNPERRPARSGLSRRDFLRVSSSAAAYGLVGGFGALAAACGADSEENGAVGDNGEMTFWNLHAPGGPSEAASAWFEDMVNDWNETGERPISLHYIPAADYAEGTPLRTAFAAGDGPDIFLLNPTDFLRYWNQDLLLDLTPYLPSGVVDDFFDAPIETRLVDGRVYGIPFEAAPVGMYYSIDALEEAGISEDNLPTTWDDYLALAEQLTTPERFGALFETNPGAFQNFMWWPWFWQTGAEIVTADNRANFDAGREALTFWKEAVEGGLAPRTVQGPGSMDIVSNLVNGYCATQQCGTWALATLRDAEPDFRYGVYPLPTPPGGTYTTVTGGWGFVVNSQGRDPEAAAQFVVQSLASEEEESSQRHADWAILRTAMPTRHSALELAQAQGALQEGAGRVFAEDIYPEARSEPRYPPEVNDAVNEAIQATQLGGADVDDAAAAANERIDAFMSDYDGGPLL